MNRSLTQPPQRIRDHGLRACKMAAGERIAYAGSKGRTRRTGSYGRDIPRHRVSLRAHGFGVRRGVNSGGKAALVTLGYPESGHQLRELRYLVLHAGPARPHRSPTTSRHGSGSPQDPHGLNGTLRYTCYACERHGEQPVSSVDARELGCRSLFQVSALGMTVLLKSGRSTVRSCP